MKYEVEIIIRRYRFGPDFHYEIFDNMEDAKRYIENVKRDQPKLMGYRIRKIEVIK